MTRKLLAGDAYSCNTADGYHKQARKSRAPLRSTSSSTPVRPRDALMGTPHVNVSPVLSEATYAVLYVWILSLIPVKLYSGLTE